MEIVRHGPLVTPESHPAAGTNINGPSLVRMPDWATGRLGRYHLYFADHKGSYIRLAYADTLDGPWRVHRPGSLQLEGSYFPTEPLPLDDDEFEQHKRRYEEVGTTNEVISCLHLV